MNDRLLIGVMTSQNNFDRVINIRETWGKGCDLIFYSDHEDKDFNIVKVSDRTDYHSNEEKQLNFINNILVENADRYDWFFLCDDDTFTNVKNLFSFIEKVKVEDSENLLFGQIITYKKDYQNPIYKVIPHDCDYLSGGAGCLIKSEFFKKHGRIHNYNSGFCDVSVGLNLYRLGIKPKHSELFNSQPPIFYKHSDEDIKKSISYHYIKTKEQIRQLYELCYND